MALPLSNPSPDRVTHKKFSRLFVYPVARGRLRYDVCVCVCGATVFATRIPPISAAQPPTETSSRHRIGDEVRFEDEEEGRMA